MPEELAGASLVPIADDGNDGGPLCLDVAERSSQLAPVVLWDHDHRTVSVPLYDNFGSLAVRSRTWAHSVAPELPACSPGGTATHPGRTTPLQCHISRPPRQTVRRVRIDRRPADAQLALNGGRSRPIRWLGKPPITRGAERRSATGLRSAPIGASERVRVRRRDVLLHGRVQRFSVGVRPWSVIEIEGRSTGPDEQAFDEFYRSRFDRAARLAYLMSGSFDARPRDRPRGTPRCAPTLARPRRTRRLTATHGREPLPLDATPSRARTPSRLAPATSRDGVVDDGDR